MLIHQWKWRCEMKIIGRYLAVSGSVAVIISLILLVSAVYTPVAMAANGINGTTAVNIWYVDQDADGGADGTSWINAFNYLQDALLIAGSGDQIWVANGTYTADQGVGITLGDRAATLQLKDGVGIYGGFTGNPVTPEERDWQVHESILSGDLGGGQFSYHVVTGSGTGATAVLDGFTITAGNADGGSSSDDGGGLYNNGGSPTLVNCTFSENHADGDGGAMYTATGSPTLTNCTFNQNNADGYGGGIYNDQGDITLLQCTFNGNTALTEGGAVFNFQAGSVVFTDCIFSGNSVGGSWGGGGAVLNNTSGVTFTDCVFFDNSADMGGAMFNTKSSLTMINCVLTANTAAYYGGSMYNDKSGLAIINCTFSGNSAGSSWASGAVDAYGSPSTVTVTNSIFWGNVSPGGGQISVGTGVTLNVNNCDIEGGIAGVTGSGTINWGAGNIDADPLFEGAVIMYTAVGPAGYSLRLGTDSPCIDTGDDSGLPASITTDLDGKDRFVDGNNDGTETVDMGAYEAEAEYVELTPEEQIEIVEDGIEELISDDTLNKGQGNALVSKLENALSSLDKGNVKATINKLEAFINQIDAYVDEGIMTEGEAFPLRDAALAVIGSLLSP
jgi:predicted outer membrane repeat protein